MTTKLESWVDGEWVPAHYTDTFALESTTGPDRLRIAPRGDHAAIVLALVTALRPDYKVLYVLHTPRGGSAEGRYESPALDQITLVDFFERFAPFLAGDSRHDMWIHSRADDATIVWDRHDFLHAYGPLSSFEHVLRYRGLRPAAATEIPSPHAHCYHETWDDFERELVRWFNWRVTELHEEDRQ